MKVIIAGGGTGGHLFPAVAVGEELQRERPAIEVLHVGSSSGLEASWLPRSGLRYELFPVRGIRGRGPLMRLRSLGEFVAALRRALVLLRRFSPDLVIGAGGYASAPIAMAAVVLRRPLVLLEQNTCPGLANRWLARFARKICVGFRQSAAYFDTAKVAATGNPVRLAFIPSVRPESSGRLQILVLGGSSGAHRLNIGALKAFIILEKSVINVGIVHQSGEADVGLLRDGYSGLWRDAAVAPCVLPFIDDMASALDRADLIIARAGAMTVSEIALASRPAIYVPYPFHRDQQQQLNAQEIERLGGAVIIRDDERLAENLATVLGRLIADPAQLPSMGLKAHQAAMPDAAARIAQVCFAIIDEERAAA